MERMRGLAGEFSNKLHIGRNDRQRDPKTTEKNDKIQGVAQEQLMSRKGEIQQKEMAVFQHRIKNRATVAAFKSDSPQEKETPILEILAHTEQWQGEYVFYLPIKSKVKLETDDVVCVEVFNADNSTFIRSEEDIKNFLTRGLLAKVSTDPWLLKISRIVDEKLSEEKKLGLSMRTTKPQGTLTLFYLPTQVMDNKEESEVLRAMFEKFKQYRLALQNKHG